MTNVDDLARLLVPPPGEDVIIRDAVIREWDPNTFENVIEYEGIRLRNVDVGAGAAAEAQSYQPGETIQLELRFASGKRGELGIGDVIIKGRRITPGADAARQAIAWMQSTLARQLAAQIFADRIHVATVPDFDSTTSTSFTDLSTIGPVVPDVEISESGLALVTLSVTIPIINETGNMSFQVTGATSIPASNERFLGFGIVGTAGSSSVSKQFVVPLNPGVHTFTAKYHSVGGDEAFFQDRTITVIAF